uniref:cytokinin dehydrogenase n=1 Tax=Torenia fournieri TaxID=68875 RepID=L8AW47_9LAMI|nr:cytokinin oxidase/dehydrogenase [Torenia fournieri]
MTNPHHIPSHTIIQLIIACYLSTQFHINDALLPNKIQSFDIASKLKNDLESITKASTDHGNLIHDKPSSVLYPSSIDDIVALVKLSNNCSSPFTVSAKGCGHSVRGQAMSRSGVVIDMTSLNKHDHKNNMNNDAKNENYDSGIRVSWSSSLGYYADVGGEQLWIDVLRATIEHGLAPLSWTDYLYLTVGGTLSNGGISGQSFLHGPQISNVLELDVVTGKGAFVTCSEHINSELFFAVLGGLGQFGIITRARIVLDKAPTRAKWIRLLYEDFTMFTSDQETLISTVNNGPDYVEGSLITDHSPPNNWRSSFYSHAHQSKIHSLLKNNQGLLYSIELVKYYHDDQSVSTIDEEIHSLLKDLNFIPGFIFKKDVTITEFLTRVARTDNEKGSSVQSQAHPWLNLFVPKSRIHDFNAGVLVHIIARHKQTSGPILFYPLNRKKWDDRMSAVVPDEDIFYTLGLLHSCRVDESEDFDRLNNKIMEFCEKAGIRIKQYLPHYKSKEDWAKHFGDKWKIFQERKLKFDPEMILSPGQKIFNYDDRIVYSDV